MVIRIRFPGKGECLVAADQELSTVELTPRFWSPTAAPNVLFIESLDSQMNVLHKLMLRVRGRDGRLQVIDRSADVLPQFEAEKPRAAEKQTSKEKSTIPLPESKKQP